MGSFKIDFNLNYDYLVTACLADCQEYPILRKMMAAIPQGELFQSEANGREVYISLSDRAVQVWEGFFGF